MPQLNVLSLSVITFDSQNDCEKIVYHDFMDASKQEDLRIFIHAFEKVVGDLRRKEIVKFSLWSDNCAKQFHSKNPLYAILVDVPKRLVAQDLALHQLNWNFFVPYHGKCLCNAHFGHLKTALRKEAQIDGGFNTAEKLTEIQEPGLHIVSIVDPNSLPTVTNGESHRQSERLPSFRERFRRIRHN